MKKTALAIAIAAGTANAQTLTIDIVADNPLPLTGDIVTFDVIVSVADLADANFGAFADLAFDLNIADVGANGTADYQFISHGWNNTNVINGFGDVFNIAGTATDGAGITGASAQNSPPPGNFTGGPNTSLSILAYTFQIQFNSPDLQAWELQAQLSGQTTTAFGSPPFPGIHDWNASGEVISNVLRVEHNTPAPGAAALLTIEIGRAHV